MLCFKTAMPDKLCEQGLLWHVFQEIFSHLPRGRIIHDHTITLLVIQMHFLIDQLIDHFQSDLTLRKAFRYLSSVQDPWDWDRNRAEAGWDMKVWSQQLAAPLCACLPTSWAQCWLASTCKPTEREEGAAAEGDDLGGMWQGDVIRTMQKRGQQKCRKWRNMGHKHVGNETSLIPLFVEQLVRLFRSSPFEMQLDQCIFLLRKAYTVSRQTPKCARRRERDREERSLVHS